MPAGPDWQQAVRADVVDGIEAVELEVPDPDGTADRWRELLGRDGFDDRVALRWGRGERGLVTVDLHATDRDRAGDELTICGVRFRLV